MRIKASPMSGSEFYNYKEFFSIALLAAVDAHYKFIWVYIGQYGKCLLLLALIKIIGITQYYWHYSILFALLNINDTTQI